MHRAPLPTLLLAAALTPIAGGKDDPPAPFRVDAQVFHDPEEELAVFALRLEQPFLAEEFERVGELSVGPSAEAFLVYPRRARFEQRHAEFHGRLRGPGDVRLALEYEVFTEGPEGERRADVRTTTVRFSVPGEETGPRTLTLDWARAQNDQLAERLRMHPDASFLEYVLLQSDERYGVAAPRLPERRDARTKLEDDLYFLFSGGLALQPSLQRRALGRPPGPDDRDVHVSKIRGPSLHALPYDALLERVLEEDGAEPRIHDAARLVPEDQYFLHVGSMTAADRLFDALEDWTDAALLLFRARHHGRDLRAKLEAQLGVRSGGLRALFREEVVSEVALTGSDPFLAEGTDLTVLLRVSRLDAYRAARDTWIAELSRGRTDLARRTFHYRGHEILARYTPARAISAFVVELDGWAVHSNSHRAIRRVVDAAAGAAPRLADAADHRYLSTVLPPADGEDAAWFFASRALLRRLVSPAFKIGEKRRLECLNNLVMLNNAVLFHRLDLQRPPSSLSDLVEGRFLDEERLVCPHGGAYSYDAARDACACSLHNSLSTLTPNAEVEVLEVSEQERREVDRYRARYEDLPWRLSEPIAARLRIGPTITAELATLPFVDGPRYEALRESLAAEAADLGRRPAPEAVLSVAVAAGAERLREAVRAVPGVPALLDEDPALADLSWIGDTATVGLCDGDAVLEIDPTRLRPLEHLLVRSLTQQGVAAGAVSATALPAVVSIRVTDDRKADRFLDGLHQRLFLEEREAFGLPVSFDVYRRPDHRGRPVFVVTYRVYALTVRLHVARAGGALIAATRLDTLHAAVDAALDEGEPTERRGHLAVRLTPGALDRLLDDVRVHWGEKARRACHRSVLRVELLARLHGAPVDAVDALSRALYGVTWPCPDGGTYALTDDRVACSVHGRREDSRQSPAGESSFERFLGSFETCGVTLRFEDEALVATIELVRREE